MDISDHDEETRVMNRPDVDETTDFTQTFYGFTAGDHVSWNNMSGYVVVALPSTDAERIGCRVPVRFHTAHTSAVDFASPSQLTRLSTDPH